MPNDESSKQIKEEISYNFFCDLLRNGCLCFCSSKIPLKVYVYSDRIELFTIKETKHKESPFIQSLMLRILRDEYLCVSLHQKTMLDRKSFILGYIRNGKTRFIRLKTDTKFESQRYSDKIRTFMNKPYFDFKWLKCKSEENLEFCSEIQLGRIYSKPREFFNALNLIEEKIYNSYRLRLLENMNVMTSGNVSELNLATPLLNNSKSPVRNSKSQLDKSRSLISEHSTVKDINLKMCENNLFAIEEIDEKRQ